ncbi:hypothetical protein PR202_gb16797 [Eleusine coracana subsp. coracana]|uniref:Rx N-terminal domain-containing protein n=1 Tax=Eleusine coracana subsp. coracana TaxID=191504 RepID=A0AAV5F1V1_ELECO|nr:hypothetical protein PR202_gb16740 [Eleusine coracana subsp. coracana]GJN28648.1 hypothetical protein PR202_gb16797 [Eleusine coracana subsp. coracana]
MDTPGAAEVTLDLATLILDSVIGPHSTIPLPPDEVDLENDLKSIMAQFSIMRAFLADADKGSGYRSNVGRTWIRQVRNLAYDMEDYLQELVVHLEKPSHCPKKLRQPWNKVVENIRGLIQRIDETNQRYRDFFRDSKLPTGGVAYDPVKLFTTNALFIGRETEISDVTQTVIRDDTQRQIIPIWGMVLMDRAYFDGQPEIKKQADRIILKCSGLPLAISTIGGFLATRPKTAQEWESFIDNFDSELDKSSSLKNMIRRGHLIRRWIAERYLGDKDRETKGDQFFTDFINWSIIQPSEPVAVGSVASNGYCHVHSLLREIIVAQSVEEKFCFVLGSRSSSTLTHDIVRHLTISSSWRRDTNDLKAIGDMSHVRSLTVCGKWEPALELGKMRMLRVLDLEGTGELLRDHHIEPYVEKLVHLIYLSLRGCHNIYWLTHSLGNLRDLQTLDVRGTSIIILPETIVKLQKLQYLRAGQIPKDEEPRDCRDLAEPKANTRLTLGGVMKDVIVNSFRSEPKDNGQTTKRDKFNKTFFYDGHLLESTRDKHGIELPKGAHMLNSLETLGVIDVGAKKGTSTELEKLTKLRKLGVTGLRRENSERFLSATTKLTLLQSLSIRSEGRLGLQDCLDSKSSWHPTDDVQSLKLYGNLLTLPSWIVGLQKLTKLKLRSTRLGHDAIQVLGSLPCLAIMRLLTNSLVGEDLHLHFQRGSFLGLVLLQLDGLPELQSLVFEQGATPNLELLQVMNSTDIEKNGCFGLSYLPRLKEVHARLTDMFMHDLRTQLARNPNQPILREI